MTRPLVLAFYLPQFHPVPENDAWWGPGFTEWTNVVRARPLWEGHYQPHLPGELGFYDLRVPEVREQQADLARSHGISGFCYYHYWFGGDRRVIERPFTEVLRSGSPDFPFCLAWANENWTRAWDAGDQSVLMPQQYSVEDDEAHGRYLIETFGDPRYIKVNGCPLLLIYRVQQLPNPKRTLERWRTMARAAGFPDLYLVRFETHGDFREPATFGCDASAEFLPHGVFEVIPPTPPPDSAPGNLIYTYDEIARHFASRDPVPWVRHPCVFPSWDNTPRYPDGRVIAITGASVDTYEWWLGRALERAEREHPEQPMVFLNAWNEWAEGAHLEPDERHGRGYLEATLAALRSRGHEPLPSSPARVPSAVSAEHRCRDLYAKYVALQQEHTALLETMERRLSLAVDPIERELYQTRHASRPSSPRPHHRRTASVVHRRCAHRLPGPRPTPRSRGAAQPGTGSANGSEAGHTNEAEAPRGVRGSTQSVSRLMVDVSLSPARRPSTAKPNRCRSSSSW